jgi:PBSX family phage portal protein
MADTGLPVPLASNAPAAPPDADSQKLMDRHCIVKAFVVSDETQDARSNALTEQETAERSLWSNAGTLTPPYDPLFLCRQVEGSNCLGQNIAAYKTNIHQFGHKLQPFIDLTHPDADKKIADAIYSDRLAQAEDDPSVVILEPSEQEMAERRKTVELEMRRERARVDAFFASCCDRISFIELRSRMCVDRETMGYGYWEAMRNGAGKLAKLKNVPGYTVRIVKGGTYVKVKTTIRTSPISLREVEEDRFFRRFVQVCDGQTVWFKEFGDPRFVSSKTGEAFDTVEALKAKEPGATPATELIEFKIYSSQSPYGIPRWIGNLLSVAGSKKAEYINFLYFDNKSIPPLVVMVEGGVMAKSAEDNLKDFIKNEIKGADNFHKILVLQATPAEGASPNSTADAKVRIKVQPLTDALLRDGLFMEYDAKNRDKIGESFRLPKILRGDSSEVNRATADAALAFAEQQVFSPERNSFDYTMDRTVLAELRVVYHEFESLGPDLKNPEALATAAKAFENALLPNEQREIAGGVFGREYPQVDADWAKQPLAVTLAGLGEGGLGMAESAAQAAKAQAGGDALALAAHMVQLRQAVRKAEEQRAQAEFRTEKRAADDGESEEHVVHVPAALMAKWIAPIG